MILENFAEKVIKIPLQSTDESLLDDITDIVPYKEYLLVLNGDKCSLFKQNGQFIAHLGNKGNGPQEYLRIEEAFAQNDTIYLYDSSKNRIHLFNLQGKYVNSTILQEDMRHSRGTAMLPDGQIAFYLPDKGINSSWRILTIFDRCGTIKDSIVMESKLSSISPINWYFKECSFTEYDGRIRYKYTFNDTIYNLHKHKGKFHTQPAYIFALGDAKAIENAREEVARTMMQPKMFDPFKKMVKIELIGESDKYLFFAAKNRKEYFYNKETGEVHKYKLFPKGLEEKCTTDTKFFVPLKLSSNGILWCVMQSGNDNDNPIIIKAGLH